MSRGAHYGLLALLLWGCGEESPNLPAEAPIGGVTGEELAAEQVLHKGNYAEPQTLDPHKAEGVPSSNILRDLFEGLIGEAPNGELIPGVALRWDISTDGRRYRFYLDPEARWSNGEPLTARDFEYGLRRSVDPLTLSRYAWLLKPIVNAEAVSLGQRPVEDLGVRAIDGTTLEINLNEPTPYFLGVLTHSSTYPAHRASIEQHGDQHARPGKLVSNGAYQLTDWLVQSHIRLSRNTHYRLDSQTIIDEVWYYPEEDQATELKRYRAGALDFTYELPYQQLDWIRENLAEEMVIAPYLGSYYYGFNVTRPPFKDNLALRQALTLAVDRETLTEKITGAGEIPAYGWVPPLAGYEGQVMLGAEWDQARRYDEARRLYAEAGYSESNPLTLEILYNTNENHKKVAIAIAFMWKDTLGVDTKLVNQEWKVFLDTRAKKETTEVFRAGWIGDYNDAYTFASLMHSKSGRNDPGYDNPDYDELLARASRQQDPGRRAALLQEAEVLLLRDLPILPIYFYVSKRMVKPWVAGFQPNIMDHHYTRNFRILKH